MCNTTPLLPGLSPISGKTVEATFDGGSLTSDAGVLVLREVERRLDVGGRLGACIADDRQPGRIRHSLADVIRFRMLMIACGYEGAIDADSLRSDPGFKMALDRLPSAADLCSQSTISRLENRPEVRTLLRMASMRFAGRLPTIKSSSRLCGSPGLCRLTVRPSCHRVEDRPRSSWKLPHICMAGHCSETCSRSC